MVRIARRGSRYGNAPRDAAVETIAPLIAAPGLRRKAVGARLTPLLGRSLAPLIPAPVAKDCLAAPDPARNLMPQPYMAPTCASLGRRHEPLVRDLKKRLTLIYQRVMCW